MLTKTAAAKFVLLTLLLAGPAHAEPTEAVPTVDPRVARLIFELDTDDFAARQSATEELKKMGTLAVDPLATAATQGNSLEAAVRAIDILEAIYVSADRVLDDELVDQTEHALEELQQSGKPSIAGRADRVLDAHYSIRERRAIVEIQRLGGVAQSDNFTVIDLSKHDARSPRPNVALIQIDHSWTGGDEGLKHVRRMWRLPLIYLVKGGKNQTYAISDEAIEGLERSLPLVRIEYRGNARLGIGAIIDPGQRGCVINHVMPNSAAAKAGIIDHDILTEFDGHPIESFDGLVDLLKGYSPGQKAKAIVKRERERQVLSLDVVLEGWEEPGQP